MKKIFALSLIAIVIAAVGIAQTKQIIEPSGNIITKDVSVKPFDAIKAQGLYELILSQGDKESVKIEADDNVQGYFTVSNENNTLVIDMPALHNNGISFNNNKDRDKTIRWKVYVSFKNLKSIDIAVVGNIHSVTPLKSDAFEIDSKNVGNIDLQLTTAKLTIHNQGVGNITLAGNATNAVITNSGVGKFEGDDLVVETMNIDNSGVGNANVNVQKDLTIKQTFLGKVSNKGTAKKHEMDGVEM